MKRFLAILMAAVMLFSFAACTGAEDEEIVNSGTREFTSGYDETKYNVPGTFPVFKEKQSISVIVSDTAVIEDWETNKQTLFMEEQLNADLVLTIMPGGEFSTKLNLMAAAGGEEFTDVIMGSFADGMTLNFADAGVILPITEYAYNTDLAHNMLKGVEALGWDYYPYLTMPDGEIYGLPKINDSILANNSKMWFYIPWFEEAGVDASAIHTTEDFKEALLKVVKSDPNGNGKADEVGISSYGTSLKWMHYLMNAFVYAGGENYLYVEDGKVNFAFLRDEWRDGLEYIKELYDLGLIDPLAFSQDSNSFKAMLNYEDTLVAAWAMTDASRVAEEDPRRVQYLPIPPLNSSWNDGEPLSSHTPTNVIAGMYVSLNAKDPEAAFVFGDYMCSEEMSIFNRYGERGVDWFEPKEGDVAMYDALGYEPFLTEGVVWGSVQNSYWAQTGPFIRTKEHTAGIVWNGEPNIIKTGADGQLLYEGTGPKEEIKKLIYTESENEIITDYMSNVITFVDEATVGFIRGERNLDSDWEAFQQSLSTMNTEELLETVQSAYDRMEAVTK